MLQGHREGGSGGFRKKFRLLSLLQAHLVQYVWQEGQDGCMTQHTVTIDEVCTFICYLLGKDLLSPLENLSRSICSNRAVTYTLID